MKQTLENYLNLFVQQSQTGDCDNLKAHDAALMRQHWIIAAAIVKLRVGPQVEDYGSPASNAWRSQNAKAKDIMYRHFGLHATTCKPTIDGCVMAIHQMGGPIINVPGEDGA